MKREGREKGVGKDLAKKHCARQVGCVHTYSAEYSGTCVMYPDVS